MIKKTTETTTMMPYDSFMQLAKEINALVQQYTNHRVKHIQYCQEYDAILERFRMTKKTYRETVEYYFAKFSSSQGEPEANNPSYS